MVKIRALLAVLIMACGLLLGFALVSTADIKEPELTVSDVTVRNEQEIELVLSLDGYDNIKTGINTVKGTLEYDPDIFEKPAQEDFEPLNSWESVYYNPENGQFALICRAGCLEGGEVLRLTLTAKKNLPEKDTSVIMSGLSASEGKKDIFPDDVEVKLTTASEQHPGGSNPGTGGGQTPPGGSEDTEGEQTPPGDSEDTEGEQTPPGDSEDTEGEQTPPGGSEDTEGEQSPPGDSEDTVNAKVKM